MKLEIKKVKTLSQSKQSQSVQDGLRQYQEYWRKAKGGNNPEIIRITGDQFKKLGVDAGYMFNGSKLELI